MRAKIAGPSLTGPCGNSGHRGHTGRGSRGVPGRDSNPREFLSFRKMLDGLVSKAS
jgi:hypothetical protein